MQKQFLIITSVLFIIMLIIPILFFALLDSQTGAGFGLKEILFSVAFAIIVTLFLLWICSFIRNRPYLGAILGIIGIIAASYGIFLQFRGPYTTTFVLISDLLALIYTGYYFIKFRKASSKLGTRDDYDDNLSRQK